MAKVEVEMPQMGESVMEGTVIEWKKKVGDKVEVDETLLEIATDKVDTEVPSPEAGVLVEILVEEDETVEVGQTIAIIDTEADPSEADAEPSGEAESKEESSEKEEKTETEADEPEKTEDESADEDEGERIEVEMPQMGESVMEGTVIEWAKKVGDKVEVDETLLEIATDKVDTEVPSPEAGTLVEILVEEGETVEVGQTIAIIATGKAAESAKSGEKKKDEKKSSAEKPASKNGTSEESEKEAKESTSKPQRKGSDGRFYSPLVRSIASEEGITQEELESIEGSGKEGRVSKEDILSYVEDKKAGKVKAPSGTKGKEDIAQAAREKGKISAGELDVHRPHENVEIVKMDRMRKMIAEHMVRSKQTSAHVTTFSDVDVTSIVKWREANKKKFYDQTGVKLTYTPIFIEAFIQAIGEFPLINSSVDGDEIHLKKDINFGLAVALGEGGKGGLIVPVIKQAQNKNLAGLAKSVHDLADKARTKDLSPDDLVGGTITLTNYGSVGNLMGTPIINQPQVAILGTGVIEKRPVVLETEQGDVIAIRHKMYLSMSYDHRIIDGAHGGAFMSRVKQLLENFDADRAI
ncbi:2-oxoglutarate dehydrogenase, E2 component, dihydrolipoamide succinyltransferase [Rhodohalobacter sp. 614A]|uniref:2-oxoglutarate dehydrogenase, E2 component, dihydrolipoamide succinyltransferase n=1 Tax=Rhodohalobacter sp. 614A TaxID=2908649 RepID=UPI001F18E3F1|nr:2-oxoglutarate dehydrogenase, E2 component, dihydrolipoamide succinyltransferase [Rhodohalobacter sp. 614A]